MAASRKKKQLADFRDEMLYVFVSLAASMTVLGFIKPDKKPHEASRQNYGLGFSHVYFFFGHNQSVAQNKNNQRKITHPNWWSSLPCSSPWNRFKRFKV